MIPADKTVSDGLTLVIGMLDRLPQFAGSGLSTHMKHGIGIAERLSEFRIGTGVSSTRPGTFGDFACRGRYRQ